MTISLRAYRVNKGLTIEQVAKQLEVSQNTIRNWERGERKPKKVYVEALAKLYGVDTKQIFLQKNYQKQ